MPLARPRLLSAALALLILFFTTAPTLCMAPLEKYERKGRYERARPRGETRLAIAMGGAVALGAFEAGILAELTHRLAIDNDTQEDHTYVIDVLAGASAGSMSLAVLARELYNPSTDVFAADYPERSVFHDAWVKNIGVRQLIDDRRTQALAKDPFLFDEQVIYDIANSALGCSLQQGVPSHRWKFAPAPGARGATPLSLAPERLGLGMTLSNMDGLSRPVHFEGAVYWQTFYDDRRMFLLSPFGAEVALLRDEEHKLGWNDVAQTAIASGAFPFAFEPVALERLGVEYEFMPGEFESPEDRQVFHYIDGGFFDNDPLHLAQQLAREIKLNPSLGPQQRIQQSYGELLSSERRFIYLAPTVPVMESEDSEEGPDSASQTPTDNLMPYAQHIVAMGLGAAGGQGFREYIRDADTNQRAIRSLLIEVRALMDDRETTRNYLSAIAVLGERNVTAGETNLLRRFLEFAPDLARSKPPVEMEDLPEQIASRVDLKFDWGMEAEAAEWLHDGAAWEHRQLFLRLFEERELLATNNFVLITATKEQPVAGGAFSHFGGFFNRELREFDFLLGRFYAQQALRHDFGIEFADTISTGDLDEQREPLKSIRTLADHFENLDERIHFRKQAEKRLGGYVDHLDIPRLAKPWAYSAGNRWLDTMVYHQPRGFLLRAIVGNDESRTVSGGVAVDPLNFLSRALGRDKHKDSYDAIFRRGHLVRPQIFLAADYGYWHPSQRAALDWGVILQLHWRLNDWIAPRPTFEFGRRGFPNEHTEGWYHSIGIELGSIHLGVKTDRSPSLRNSRPRSLLRLGFSFRPATAWRALVTLF